MRQRAPNETRTVEACFIQSGHQQPHAEARVPTATPAPGKKAGHGEKKDKWSPVHTAGTRKRGFQDGRDMPPRCDADDVEEPLSHGLTDQVFGCM